MNYGHQYEMQEVQLLKEVTPALDRFFPGWQLISAWQPSPLNDAAIVEVQTPSLYLKLVRGRERKSDDLYIAPTKEDADKRRTIYLPWIQQLMKEGFGRQGMLDYLEWLNMHPFWAALWADRKVFDAYIDQDATVKVYGIDFYNRFWDLTPDEVDLDSEEYDWDFVEYPSSRSTHRLVNALSPYIKKPI
jgi:hypothetical protein